MDNKRESFVFYQSFMDVIDLFDTEEDRTRMLWAIVTMGFTDEIPEDIPLAMKTALIQQRASIRGAKNRRDRAVENGGKRGAPKGNQNAKGHGAPVGNSNAKKTNNSNNLNVNVNENVNDNINIYNVNESTSDGSFDSSILVQGKKIYIDEETGEQYAEI